MNLKNLVKFTRNAIHMGTKYCQEKQKFNKVGS